VSGFPFGASTRGEQWGTILLLDPYKIVAHISCQQLSPVWTSAETGMFEYHSTNQLLSPHRLVSNPTPLSTIKLVQLAYTLHPCQRVLRFTALQL